MAWPPALVELKEDLDIDDSTDDILLQMHLDAAVEFVERFHDGRYDFAGLVNLNTATSTVLQTLPGVDAPLAQNIIDGRPYAAVADVEAVVGETVFADIEGLVTVLPVPGSDFELGTIRLAGRWFTRRRSPDGLVSMAELGGARVPSFDPDIERLLRIGRHSPVTFA